MQTVLISGGHGFLGRYVSNEFKKNGFYVIGIGHGDWLGHDYKEFGFDEWFRGDVSIDNLKEIKKEMTHIVHCAGGSAVGRSIEMPMQEFKVTVDSALAILEYCRYLNSNIKLLITSSAAVYGIKPNEPISEDMELIPVSPYGYYKKIVEDLADSYRKNFNVSVSVIRFFSLYGNGLRKQLLWDACRKILLSENKNVSFFGNGDETRDWIHVSDAASLIYYVLVQNSKNNLIINGGIGQKIQIKEVLNLLAHNLNPDIKIEFNNVSRSGDPKYFLADTSKLQTLKWKPNVNLETGIKNYVTWFKENYD